MSDKNAAADFLDALERGAWGTFPFGRPNARRHPTLPTDTSRDVLAVLGVYPSALHLSWNPPGGSPKIGALAVDVEPTVFWPGDHGAARAARIAHWKAVTGDDGTRGDFGWATFNGSSGVAVARDYLEPLDFTYAQCFLTDCVPFFFVKAGADGQANAINKKWKPRAAEHGWPGGDLPSRPSPQMLVTLAARAERGLAAELASAQPFKIVTLGQEAADALKAVVEVVAPPPGLPLQAHDDHYGVAGRIMLGGREAEWIPLAHPGATSRADTAWNECHQAWKAAVTPGA